MRKYFISYFFADRRGNTGFGRVQVNRWLLIRNMDDIAEIESYLKKQNRFKAISVMNWQLLEEPKALLTEGRRSA